jgi:hypothetical protein
VCTQEKDRVTVRGSVKLSWHRGRIMRVRDLGKKVSYLLVLTIFLQSVLVLFSAEPASGQEPDIVDIGGGRRTATWALDDPGFYTSENVTFDGGGANLTLSDFSWHESEQVDFLDGTWDENVTIASDGNLTLMANNTNLVTNGDFSSDANWTFANGTGDNVIAERNDTQENAHVHYYGSAGPSEVFDPLDDWTDILDWNLQSGDNRSLSTESHLGAGCMNLSWTPLLPTDEAVVRRVAPTYWDWGLYNRLSLWLDSNYSGDSLEVYLTLVDTAMISWDAPRKNVNGSWKEYVFDLEGSAANMSQVLAVYIHFTGVGGFIQWNVSVDHITLYRIKIFNETGYVNQTFYKANRTEDIPGNVLLSYDVLIEECANVTNSNLSFMVSNSSDNYTWRKDLVIPPYSSHVGVDLSWLMAEPGEYNITIELHLSVNTTLESSYSVRFDNITILAPNRKNGTYLSELHDTGSKSIWTGIAWVEGPLDPETNVTVKTRTGNSTNLLDGTWSDWAAAQLGVINSPNNTFIQYRVDLNTTNASKGPVLAEVRIDYEHYASQGHVMTDNLTVSDLHMWEEFFVKDSIVPETSIDYYYSSDRGGSWSPITNGSSLSSVTNDTLKFKALLSSDNTTFTPYLFEMNLTYQYKGPLDHIHMSESSISVVAGTAFQLSAWGHDIYHRNVSFLQKWSTTDPWGSVDGSGNYSPKKEGIWRVYCNNTGDSVSNWTEVNVSAASLMRIGIEPWNPGILSADDQLQFTSTGYDVVNNTITISPNWSVTGNIGTIGPTPNETSMFIATTVGTGVVCIDDAGYQNCTNTIQVVPGARSRIEIEPQQPGNLTADEEMQFNATEYDSDENLIGDASVNWTVVGGIGTMPIGPLVSSLFNATKVGVGWVFAEDGLGHTNRTELFWVVAGQLASIEVEPNPANIFPGASENFTAQGYDSDGNNVTLTLTSWETDVGTIPVWNSTNAILDAQLTETSGGYVRATEGTVSGEAVVNIDNNDEPPFVKSTIPNQERSEDFGSWTLDLAPFAGDAEDSLSLLRWRVVDDDPSLYTVAGGDTPGNHVLTFSTMPDAFGNDEMTLLLIDSFDQEAQQSLWVNITPVNDKPILLAPDSVHVRYDVPVTRDYAPHVSDVDNSTEDLTLSTDDSEFTTVQGLKVTYDYPKRMAGEVIFVVLTLSDGIDQDQDVVEVVVSSNFPPRLMLPIADIIMEEDQRLDDYFDLDDHFEDPDDDKLTYDAVFQKARLEIDPNGMVSLYPEMNWFGEELIIFTATDKSGAVAQDAVLVTVTPVNDPPTIQGLPLITIRYAEEYRFDVTPYVSDIDNPIEELIISCSEPDNTTIEGRTIVFLFPVKVTVDITVTVSDGQLQASDDMRVKVTDNRPPVTTGLPDIFFYEDQSYPSAFDLDDYFTDPDVGDLIYFYNQTQNFVLVAIDASNLVSFSSTENWSGQQVIVFRAVDEESAIVEDSIIVTVIPVNDAPVIFPIPRQVGQRNKPWILNVGPYIYDSDNVTGDLTIQVDSEYVTAVGHYLIFNCESDISLDEVETIVSDGFLQSSRDIEVSVSSPVSPSLEMYIWPTSIGIAILGVVGLLVWRASRRYSMEDLFVVGKEGKLLVHKTKRARPDRDEDILAGMLTAIQEFAKDTFREEKDTLRAFELQERKVVIETAQNFYVAAIFAGKEPRWASKSLEAFVNDIETVYGETIKSWSGDMDDLETLPEMADFFIKTRKYQEGDWETP